MPVQAPEALYRPWLGRERAAGRAGRAPWIEAQSSRTFTRKPPMHVAAPDETFLVSRTHTSRSGGSAWRIVGHDAQQLLGCRREALGSYTRGRQQMHMSEWRGGQSQVRILSALHSITV